MDKNDQNNTKFRNLVKFWLTFASLSVDLSSSSRIWLGVGGIWPKNAGQIEQRFETSTAEVLRHYGKISWAARGILGLIDKDGFPKMTSEHVPALRKRTKHAVQNCPRTEKKTPNIKGKIQYNKEYLLILYSPYMYLHVYPKTGVVQ